MRVSSRTTMVESNMKVHIWLVKTLHNVLFSFALYLDLFLPSWLLSYIDFVAFTFSVSPTVGCVQHSTPQNTYVVEDQPHCPLRSPLSRTAVLPCPPSVQTVRANWHSWVWRTHMYVRTHIHCENRFLIQSLMLICSAIMIPYRPYLHDDSHIQLFHFSGLGLVQL